MIYAVEFRGRGFAPIGILEYITAGWAMPTLYIVQVYLGGNR